ncbi:MAG: glycosyltransferase, partial [Akkermansia sp.]
MNILFLVNNYPGFRGIEMVTLCLAKAIAETGVNVSVLSMGTDSPELANNPAFAFPVPVYVPQPQITKTQENLEFIRDYLTCRSFDYIIYQDSYEPSDWIFREIDYPWEQKLIVVEHNIPTYSLIFARSLPHLVKSLFCPILQPFGYLAGVCLRPFLYLRARRRCIGRHSRLLRICRSYVLLSESYIPLLARLCGAQGSESKVHALSNPLTIAPPRQSRFAKKKQILFVGALTRQKGIDHLLNIWKIFSTQNHSEWQLVLAGQGKLEKHIRKRIEREHIQHIHLRGVTADVESLYEESAILVMTSIFEGFPLVLNEAMSRGCVPMAFASFSAVYDIVDDGSNGVLIPPFQENTYAHALSRIVDDSEWRERMSAAAMEKAQQFKV